MITALLIALLSQTGTCKEGQACSAASFKATKRPLNTCAPLVVPCFLSDGGTDGGSCNDGGFNPSVRGLLEYDYNGQFTDAGTYVVCNGRTWVGLQTGSGTDTCTGTGPCAIGQGGITTDAGTNVLVARVAGLPNEVFKITDASGHAGIGLTWENGVSDWYLQKLGGGTNQDMVIQLGLVPMFTFTLAGDLTLGSAANISSFSWTSNFNSCLWAGLGSQLYSNCIIRSNTGLALDGTGALLTMDNAGRASFSGTLGFNSNGYELNGSRVSFGGAPTVTAGCGTSPSIVYSNGTAAWTVNVGTGGTAQNCTVTLGGAAAHRWICKCTNYTSGNLMVVDGAGTSTTFLFANFDRLTGLTTPFNASDEVDCMCAGE